MATSVTANVAGVFADGATVGAYPASNWGQSMVNQSVAPVGSATATGTVTAGSVTITGLTTNTQYALAVSGGTRYLMVNTTDVTAGRQQTSEDIADGTIAAVDVASDVATDAELTVVTANTQTDSYTLVLGDAGKCVEINKATATTLTIPPNSSVAFPTGTVIEVHRYGAGTVTITEGVGVTTRSNGDLVALAAQYSSASLRKRGTNEWIISGDLA